MAEVLSLIVAAPALVDLAKYCGKLAIELYNYSEERQIAKFEIANYANQVTCSSTTIRTSHATLGRYHQRFPESMVLQDLATEGAIKATEDMSKSILGRLVSVTDDLIDQNDTPISAIKYIKWRFRKKGVLEVILQLGRVQQNIQLIVNMLSIESHELEIKRVAAVLERQLNREANSKIKALKKQIREQQSVIEDQLKTISRLEKQAKCYGVDQQVSSGLKALHRLGNLIINGGMDALLTERILRQHPSWSSLSSQSNSSASSSRSSSTSSFGARIRPYRPGGSGGSGGPIPRSGNPISTNGRSRPSPTPAGDRLVSNTSRKVSLSKDSKSSTTLPDGNGMYSQESSTQGSDLVPDEHQHRELEHQEKERQEEERKKRRLEEERQEEEEKQRREEEQKKRREEERQEEEEKQRREEEQKKRREEERQEEEEKQRREEEQERLRKKEQRRLMLEEREREDLARQIRERRGRKPSGTDRESVYAR